VGWQEIDWQRISIWNVTSGSAVLYKGCCRQVLIVMSWFSLHGLKRDSERDISGLNAALATRNQNKIRRSSRPRGKCMYWFNFDSFFGLKILNFQQQNFVVYSGFKHGGRGRGYWTSWTYSANKGSFRGKFVQRLSLQT
jgi:hypothetical protein